MVPLIKFDKPLPEQNCSLVLGLGVFDGVHRGHRKIMASVLEIAAACGALPVAVTFDPHPRALLFPENPPPLLLPLKERCRLLRECGAALTGIIPFTQQVSVMEPELFLQELLQQDFKLAGICVGKCWRFGCGGRGTEKTIQKFARQNRICFYPCPELAENGQTISSTAIRNAVLQGDLELASRMLGRPVRLFGSVAKGNQVAGTELKTPTANMEISAGILPPDGVYSGSITLEGKAFPAAVNIGLAPTFNVNKRRVEAHLLDFDGNLYDRELELELFHCLRAEKHFETPDALAAQIRRDIVCVRQDFDRYKKELKSDPMRY